MVLIAEIFHRTNNIVSGCIGIVSSPNQETVVPCPYNVILGRDTALPSPLYHSGITGIDITRNVPVKEILREISAPKA